jgi:hypothetical protein
MRVCRPILWELAHRLAVKTSHQWSHKIHHRTATSICHSWPNHNTMRWRCWVIQTSANLASSSNKTTWCLIWKGKFMMMRISPQKKAKEKFICKWPTPDMTVSEDLKWKATINNNNNRCPLRTMSRRVQEFIINSNCWFNSNSSNSCNNNNKK